MKSKRQNLVQRVLAEPILYAGLVATRREAYLDALPIYVHNAKVKFGMNDRDAEREGRKAADRLAFGQRAVALTAEQAASLPRFSEGVLAT